MRIKNRNQLIFGKNAHAKRMMLDILDAGLQASDPYQNALKLLHREGNILFVGNPDFEPENDPQSGTERYDLNEFEHIWLVGAGKGVQRVALAFYEILGDRLTGGELIAKYGDELILPSNLHVTLGAHPVPDENCVVGSKQIVELSRRVSEKDLVITVIANGGSALLTLPMDGVPLEDAMRIVQLLQIEKGAKTEDLNKIRNHIDQLKGGRISRLFKKARQLHIEVADVNHYRSELINSDYYDLMTNNMWLHNLPDGTTFSDAVEVLDSYDVWDETPESIRKVLLEADPDKETVKYDEFSQMKFRVFGIMPGKLHYLYAAKKKAEEYGFHTYILSRSMDAEAFALGKAAAGIGMNILYRNEPVSAPAVLLSAGEMRVTVDKFQGVGGRNQEYVLSAACEIGGRDRILIASVDTDGTDGPGGLDIDGAPRCLGGGIVDGESLDLAEKSGVDLKSALIHHATSEALWRIHGGIEIEQNISLNDLSVIMVTE